MLYCLSVIYSVLILKWLTTVLNFHSGCQTSLFLIYCMWFSIYSSRAKVFAVFPTGNFCSIQLTFFPEFQEFSIEPLVFRKFTNFWFFWKLSQETSAPIETRPLFLIARFSTSLLIHRDKHGLSLYFALLARLLIINNIYTHAAAKCQPFLQHFFFHKFFKQKIKPPFLFFQALNRNKTVLFLLSQGDVMERARIWIHK